MTIYHIGWSGSAPGCAQSPRADEKAAMTTDWATVTCKLCLKLRPAELLSAGNGLRAEGGIPLSVIGDIDRQSDALVVRALTERDEALAERDTLRAAICRVVESLGYTSDVTDDASIEFLCRAPDEVRVVVDKLKKERNQAWEHGSRVRIERDEARAALIQARREGAAEMRQRAVSAAIGWTDSQDRIALAKQEDAPMAAESHAESAQIGRSIAGVIQALPLPGDEQ